MKLAEKIPEWIKEQVKKSGKKGIVVGLSGGIDSAVTAVLSKKALGNRVLGLVLPCQSNSEDERLALMLAKNFRIQVKKIDLEGIHKEFCKIHSRLNSLARANLKPRLRMVTLYSFANNLDYLVAGTGNKSELMIGYFTKYGDGGCDILPIGGLLKKDVRKLAEALEIPREIIKRPPSAGLWDGQTDEGEIGMSYQELDSCLEAVRKGKKPKINKKNLEKVKLMIKKSQHKRDQVPIFKKR